MNHRIKASAIAAVAAMGILGVKSANADLGFTFSNESAYPAYAPGAPADTTTGYTMGFSFLTGNATTAVSSLDYALTAGMTSDSVRLYMSSGSNDQYGHPIGVTVASATVTSSDPILTTGAAWSAATYNSSFNGVRDGPPISDSAVHYYVHTLDTPYVLQPNTRYYIAADVPANKGYFSNAVNLVSTNSNITYGAPVVSSNATTGGDPTFGGSGISYFPVNLGFTTVSTTSTWNNPAGGLWGTPTNWTAGVPDSAGAPATLTNLSTGSVVTVNGNRTIGNLVINNPNPVTVSGGSLTLNNSGSTATVTASGASHTVSSPLALTGGVTFNASSPLTVSDVISGTGPVTVNGNVTFSADETYAGATNVTDGTLTLSGKLPAGYPLSITGTGTLLLGTSTSVDSLTLGFSAHIDIGSSNLDLGSTSEHDLDVMLLYHELYSSFVNNDTSKHLLAIGTIQNDQGGSPIYTAAHKFGGLTPGASDFLVKATYYGDANLDGKVDGSDYSQVDYSYSANLNNPGSLTGWYNGDFNNDGLVDGSDYSLMDNAFNTQDALAVPQALNQNALSTAELAGETSSSVPEPSTFGLLVACVLGLRSRRRR